MQRGFLSEIRGDEIHSAVRLFRKTGQEFSIDSKNCLTWSLTSAYSGSTRKETRASLSKTYHYVQHLFTASREEKHGIWSSGEAVDVSTHSSTLIILGEFAHCVIYVL